MDPGWTNLDPRAEPLWQVFTCSMVALPSPGTERKKKKSEKIQILVSYDYSLRTNVYRAKMTTLPGPWLSLHLRENYRPFDLWLPPSALSSQGRPLRPSGGF